MKTSVEFFNGHKMPLIGLGTSQATDPLVAERAFEEALEIGYRHFDTAYQYNNEQILGTVLKRWLDAGKLKRDELFIVNKLPPIGMSPERVRYFLEKSLKNLNLEYIDLYLIHNPVGFAYINDEERWPKIADGKFLLDMSTDLEAIWRTMEEQVERGLAKSIGLSNFAPSQIQRIVNISKIRPANLQVELNVRFQQKKLVEFCNKLNIKMTAYSPIGSPGRKEAYIAQNGDGIKQPLIEDPVVAEMALKYNKTKAQILLRFLTQKNIAAIPKSVNFERLRNNFEIFNFELNIWDLKRLEGLDMGNEGRQFILSAAGLDQHPEYKTE